MFDSRFARGFAASLVLSLLMGCGSDGKDGGNPSDMEVPDVGILDTGGMEDAAVDSGAIVADHFSCEGPVFCYEAPAGFGLTQEEVDNSRGRCENEDWTFELEGSCDVQAFGVCREDDKVTHYKLIAADRTLEKLQEGCERNGGIWERNEAVELVAEYSVDDIMQVEMADTLAPDFVTGGLGFCETWPNRFAIGELTNGNTGFTRYHHAACYNDQLWQDVNHFTQLLRDQHETVRDVPGASHHGTVFTVNGRGFVIINDFCPSCNVDFITSYSIFRTSDAGPDENGDYVITLEDNAGKTRVLTVPRISLP